ncbi:hypothetical protein Pla100_37490 [Neorhodopirellula pilleata]|uniref:Uncharacterized protein n=1 Tax=Neorhodopirellula pilleata TaxID=2714738 RepID=A0A5C6A5E4_9BACT|nr:hypothetical protein Pla100_37490 [Neorhodopirellula pilleata]
MPKLGKILCQCEHFISLLRSKLKRLLLKPIDLILDVLQFDQCVVPTLFECRSYQTIVRINLLVTTLSQLCFVLRSLQSHLPLRIDLLVALHNHLIRLDRQLQLLVIEHIKHAPLDGVIQVRALHCHAR